MQKFVYLGPEGTFTEQALKQLDSEGQHVPVTSVNAALEAIVDGEADAAVVPIENSVEGGVSATLDAIASSKGLQIINETVVDVKFCLVSHK
ncbi:MAG: prephenate dehydratase domain-containing protein, partial [Micrococcaceae bacterium]